MIPDYHGTQYAVGARIEGWYGDSDSVRYTGTVTSIGRAYPRCRYRHIKVLRDDTGIEHDTFSDSVVVLPPGSP